MLNQKFEQLLKKEQKYKDSFYKQIVVEENFTMNYEKIAKLIKKWLKKFKKSKTKKSRKIKRKEFKVKRFKKRIGKRGIKRVKKKLSFYIKNILKKNKKIVNGFINNKVSIFKKVLKLQKRKRILRKRNILFNKRIILKSKFQKLYLNIIKSKFFLDNYTSNKKNILDPYEMILSLKTLLRIVNFLKTNNAKIKPSIIIFAPLSNIDYFKLNLFLKQLDLSFRDYNDFNKLNLKSQYYWKDNPIEIHQKLQKIRFKSRNQLFFTFGDIKPSLMNAFIHKSLFLSYSITQKINSLAEGRYFLRNNLETFHKLSFFGSILKNGIQYDIRKMHILTKLNYYNAKKKTI